MVAQYGDLLDESNKLFIGGERFRRLREQWRKLRLPMVSILWCLTNMDKKAKQSKIFFLINSHHVTFTLKCFQDLHIKKILLHSCINTLGVILNPSV